MKAELLLSGEIEERILSTKGKIELLEKESSSHMNMFNSDPQSTRKFVNDNDIKIQQLEADLKAYETAIDYASD